MEKAEKLGAANALGYAFRWSPKCFDDKCKASIAKFADMYTKDIQDPETLQYYKKFSVAIPAMEKKYGSLAEVAVALSRDRVRKDAQAPAELRMRARVFWRRSVRRGNRAAWSLVPSSIASRAASSLAHHRAFPPAWPAVRADKRPGQYPAALPFGSPSTIWSRYSLRP